jgi:hypothetical protein
MHYKGDNKNNTDTKAPDLSSLIRIGNIFVVKVLMLLPTISSTKVNMIAQYLPFNDTYNLGYASVSSQNKHIIQHLTTSSKLVRMPLLEEAIRTSLMRLKINVTP